MTINQFEKDQSLSIKNSKGNHENGKTKKNQLKQNVTINVTPKTTLFTTMEIATMETTTIRHDKKHRNHKTTIPPADQYEDEEEEEGEDE